MSTDKSKLTESLYNKDDVCILLPVLNEESSIGQVVEEFVEMGFTDILVYDGNSTDKTREIAENAGAKVIIQSGKGKGQAMIEAFELIEKKYIVMLDGDGTNLPSEVDIVLEPVVSGRADHVIGNRIEKRAPGAFTKLNLFGNNMINLFYRIAFKSNLRDTLTGYHAFTSESIKELDLKEKGFVIETEMIAECHIKEQRVEEVFTTYLPRKDVVETKLHPIKDGYRIIRAVYTYSRFYNPLFFFGIWAFPFFAAFLFFILLSVILRFDQFYLSVFLTLSLFSLIATLQFILTGALADIVARLHRKTYKSVKKISK
ncbi:MAG: S-layer glycoprotein N-glycosyltransferase AglJ [Methanosarcinaceae archaeon]|nr:S-layer glycoprotein N-glycosyltransferase AglJ [Methanosarcinaceae archaeon]